MFIYWVFPTGPFHPQLSWVNPYGLVYREQSHQIHPNNKIFESKFKGVINDINGCIPIDT